MTAIPSFDPERLLREDAWLRAFVRRLVDRDDVDDVVQQSWLLALRHRVAVADPRGWLSTVAANTARLGHRREERRRARERAAARPEALPGAAEAVARLEVLRFVAAAVCGLPEPVRSTLVLRYHEGLDANAIAARLGTTPAAVRKRLQRGRALVRRDLERTLGRDFRGLPAVLALAGPGAAPSPPGTGAATLARPGRIAGVPAVAAIVLVATLSIGAVLAARAHGIPVVPPAAPAAQGAAAAAIAPSRPFAERERTAAGRGAVRTPIAAPQDPVRGTGAPAATVPVFTGTCVADEDGSPLGGVAIEARVYLPSGHPDAEARSKQVARAMSRGDGTFALAIPGAEHHVRFDLRLEGRVAQDASLDPAKGTALGAIRFERAHTLLGLCLDAQGRPVAGVLLKLRRVVERAGHPYTFWCTTKEDGRFRRPGIAADSYLVEMERSDSPWRTAQDEPVVVAADRETSEVVVRLERLPAITGVVFGPAGAPAANVLVSVVHPQRIVGAYTGMSTRSRPDGSFVLLRGEHATDEVQLMTGNSGPHEPLVDDGTYRWDTHGVRLRAVPARAVTLTVVEHESRRAVESFSVQVQWSLPDGWNIQTTYGQSQWHHSGTFVFDRVLSCRQRLLVVPDDETLCPPSPIVIAGDDVVPSTLTIEAERLRPRAVRLVHANGSPCAEATIDLFDPAGATQFRHFDDPRTGQFVTGIQPVPLRLATATTDRDGNASLLAPPSRTDLRLVVRRPGAAAGDHTLPWPARREGEDAGRLTIELPR